MLGGLTLMASDMDFGIVPDVHTPIFWVKNSLNVGGSRVCPTPSLRVAAGNIFIDFFQIEQPWKFIYAHTNVKER